MQQVPVSLAFLVTCAREQRLEALRVAQQGDQQRERGGEEPREAEEDDMKAEVPLHHRLRVRANPLQ